MLGDLTLGNFSILTAAIFSILSSSFLAANAHLEAIIQLLLIGMALSHDLLYDLDDGVHVGRGSLRELREHLIMHRVEPVLVGHPALIHKLSDRQQELAIVNSLRRVLVQKVAPHVSPQGTIVVRGYHD